MRSTLIDVATSYVDAEAQNPCQECRNKEADGFMDLLMIFDSQAVVQALGQVNDRESRILKLKAKLLDGTPIYGEDKVMIVNP